MQNFHYPWDIHPQKINEPDDKYILQITITNKLILNETKINFMIQPHVSHRVGINYTIECIKELEEQYHHEINCMLLILLVHGLRL